ncbi:unnamed protein product [Closterium sp. NIES-54]
MPRKPHAASPCALLLSARPATLLPCCLLALRGVRPVASPPCCPAAATAAATAAAATAAATATAATTTAVAAAAATATAAAAVAASDTATAATTATSVAAAAAAAPAAVAATTAATAAAATATSAAAVAATITAATALPLLPPLPQALPLPLLPLHLLLQLSLLLRPSSGHHYCPIVLPPMATANVLTFDADGRTIEFESWLEDLHLQSVTRDISLYEHSLGSLPAPDETTDA